MIVRYYILFLTEEFILAKTVIESTLAIFMGQRIMDQNLVRRSLIVEVRNQNDGLV